MFRKSLICLIVVLFVFFCSNVFAAQYENYEWGMSKKEAIKLVKENGYSIAGKSVYKEIGEENIRYEDKLFHEKISVYLVFTPISKKLAYITIKSENSSVGSKLKPILVDKYGEPRRPNEFEDKYIWSKSGYPVIILEYSFKSVCTYYSTKYTKVFQKEQQKLNKEEAEDKF